MRIRRSRTKFARAASGGTDLWLKLERLERVSATGSKEVGVDSIRLLVQPRRFALPDRADDGEEGRAVTDSAWVSPDCDPQRGRQRSTQPGRRPS